MPVKPKPLCLAMTICDTVVDDRTTNKKSLIGLFSNVATPKVPCRHPEMNVFITLTDGLGDYDCVLKLVYEKDNSEVTKLTGKINFADKLQTVDINFHLRGLPLPKFGSYRLIFTCDGKDIQSRKFQVNDKNEVSK